MQMQSAMGISRERVLIIVNLRSHVGVLVEKGQSHYEGNRVKPWTVIKKGKPQKICFRADGTYYPAYLRPDKELDWFKLYQPEDKP